MTNINTSNLISNTTLRDYFISTKDGKIFWSSFEDVYLKNYGSSENKSILTPIVFKVEDKLGTRYAWKMITLVDDNADLDIFSNLHESPNLILLMSYLIKKEMERKFSCINESMWFKEISLSLSDKQFMVWERVRQIYSKLCIDISNLLDKNLENEK